jgi:hypothetical protein
VEHSGFFEKNEGNEVFFKERLDAHRDERTKDSYIEEKRDEWAKG